MTHNIDSIYTELIRLREENARLKKILQKHGIAYEAASSSVAPVQKPAMPQLSLEEKVEEALHKFRELQKAKARARQGTSTTTNTRGCAVKN